LSKRKKQRKRHHENQLQACSCRTNHRVSAEQLAVRTFRGHLPHRSEFRTARWPEKVAGAKLACARADDLFLNFCFFCFKTKEKEKKL
jgi:hypothetical protein